MQEQTIEVGGNTKKERDDQHEEITIAAKRNDQAIGTVRRGNVNDNQKGNEKIKRRQYNRSVDEKDIHRKHNQGRRKDSNGKASMDTAKGKIQDTRH